MPATACIFAAIVRIPGRTIPSKTARLLWTGTLAALPLRGRAPRPLRTSKAGNETSNKVIGEEGETTDETVQGRAARGRHDSLPLTPSALPLPRRPPTRWSSPQNIDDIVAIDPAEAYEFSSGEYVTQTYDRLVQYDAPDVKTLAPGLASEVDGGRRAKTITFTLRDGVKFPRAIRSAPKTWSIPGSASSCSTSRPPSS